MMPSIVGPSPNAASPSMVSNNASPNLQHQQLNAQGQPGQQPLSSSSSPSQPPLQSPIPLSARSNAPAPPAGGTPSSASPKPSPLDLKRQKARSYSPTTGSPLQHQQMQNSPTRPPSTPQQLYQLQQQIQHQQQLQHQQLLLQQPQRQNQQQPTQPPQPGQNQQQQQPTPSQQPRPTPPQQQQQQQQQQPSTSSPSTAQRPPSSSNNNVSTSSPKTARSSVPVTSATAPNASSTATAADSKKSSAPSGKKRPSTRDLNLDLWATREMLHSAALASQNEVQNELLRSKRREIDFYRHVREERRTNPGAVFGPGYQGYGNGTTDIGKTRIIYPHERKRPGGRKARELRLSRPQLRGAADALEDLVPIRLDVEFEKLKLHDTFTWNLHDRTVPIDVFSEHLVEDFHLSPHNQGLVRAVATQIIDQITDYHPHIYLEDAPLDTKLPYMAYKNDEMRVLIKLNITIGEYQLVDQFEWDINNPYNSPEDFAKVLTTDLGLSGEFMTAIAHSIREQAQLYSRYLYFVGYPFDGRPIEDDDLRNAMLPTPLQSVLRPMNHAREFAPELFQLKPDEIDVNERTTAKEARKNKRRLNRRGGPALPDLKEVPKTHRSQIVSTVLPGGVLTVEEMRLYRENLPGESESESSESEAPSPEPMPAILPGMTRRQRNAAVAAASALRSANRSMTPEIFEDHPRAARRREKEKEREREREEEREREKAERKRIRKEERERERERAAERERERERERENKYERRLDVPFGTDSLLVRLKIGRDKMMMIAQKVMVAQRQAAQMQAQQQIQHSIQLQQHNPAAMQSPTPSMPHVNMMFPPSTPSSLGAGPTKPPVPQWLTEGLAALQTHYPTDRFEGMMRLTPIDSQTGQPIVPNTTLPPGRMVTEHRPRIRCFDCPGKLYTPGPGETVENFEVHLKNRGHRERVEARINGAAPPASPAAPGAPAAPGGGAGGAGGTTGGAAAGATAGAGAGAGAPGGGPPPGAAQPPPPTDAGGPTAMNTGS